MKLARWAMDVKRAVGARNGLMLTVLALCPNWTEEFFRLGSRDHIPANSGVLEADHHSESPHQVERDSGRRRLPSSLSPHIELYLNEARTALLAQNPETRAMWISSTTGLAFAAKNLGSLISKLTRETISVDVPPHLFRTAAATTAAAYATHLPRRASAILGHADARITEEHYQPRQQCARHECFVGYDR